MFGGKSLLVAAGRERPLWVISGRKATESGHGSKHPPADRLFMSRVTPGVTPKEKQPSPEEPNRRKALMSVGAG